MRNNTLHMATEEQRIADENVLRLVEEQKREKEVALKERHLDEKQKLAMEIEELKSKLGVVKHMGDDDDDDWPLKNVVEKESYLDERQKLEMEIEEMLGKLEVIKHMGDDEYDHGRVDQMDELLQEYDDELHVLEELNNRLRIWDSTH